MLWGRGYWEPEGTKGPEQALAKGDFKFNLEGERLHGGFVLVRMAHDRERNKRTNWLLIINANVLAFATASVAAGGPLLLGSVTSIRTGACPPLLRGTT